MADRKLFKDVLFELFKEVDNYDRVIHQFMRAYDMFNNTVKGFQRMSTVNQYYICETAARISIASSDRVIREVSIFRSRNQFSETEINYSLDYGYVEPEKLNIIKISRK